MKDLEDEEITLRVEKDPLLGKKFAGRYEIVSVLGRGGMGVVYKALQVDIDRFVAIKTLHLSRIADSQVIQRFRTEAQAVSRVRHPNTVTLYDFGVSQEGVPFLVMEILDGVSFRTVLKDGGVLTLSRANIIFQQVASALAFAHESGVIHKDLKPENIMLCNRTGQPDWVYVLDFGIAGLLGAANQQVSEIIGSPPYMSPEQCSTEAIVDHRSDIYSLAVCLFEALSGRFPYKARSAMEMLDCHLSQAPLLLKELDTRLSRYESLTHLISKAMEKRPEKRHQSIKEFAAELEDAIKKDSMRGLQLRTRASLEIETPRLNEFADLMQDNQRNDETSQPEYQRNLRPKGLVEDIRALIAGDIGQNSESTETESDLKYHFSSCPHCDAPTEPGISLCLICGRSLAAKDDFSKIRASRGDFSLPKYQELGPASSAARGFSQRTRNMMLKSGKEWTRSSGLWLITIILLLCVFIACGGAQQVLQTVENGFSSGATQHSGKE